MPATVVLFPTVQPRLTEAFLLGQQDVVDASVWVSDGRMYAHVTLTDDAKWNARTLAETCEENLGIGQTPSEFILRTARRRAA